MKILVCIYSLHLGGAERAVSTLTREWSKSHDVTLVLSDSKNSIYDHGGKIIDIGCKSRNKLLSKCVNIFRRAYRLQSIIKAESPEKIISFMEASNFPAIMACMITSNLDLLTVSVRNNPIALRAPYRSFLSIFYRFPREVIAVSEGVMDSLKKLYGLDKTNVRTIPNGVDYERVCRLSLRPPTYNLIDEYTIVAAGRLVPAKGYDLLIRSFSIMLERYDGDRIKLVILGEGPARTQLSQLISELGLESRVFLPGIDNNPFASFAVSLCFVLSSRYEGMPNSLLEAMATGCAVISFDCPYGPNQLIESEKNGLLVPPLDCEVLADQLLRLIENEDLRKRLADNAALTGREYDINKIAPLWL